MFQGTTRRLYRFKKKGGGKEWVARDKVGDMGQETFHVRTC